MNRTLLITLFAFAFSFLRTPVIRAENFMVASWNLENLFDTEDDPNVEFDEEYTPDAPKHWTPERLDIKLANLASIIKKMNDGKGPDVLGVCEIENRKVLEMLVAKLKPLGRKYEIVHKDSPSERGIDCAIIYDSAVFSLADSKFHHVDAENTRDITEARLRHNNADLYVFMDHWPSRHHAEKFRNTAADTLRKRVDELMTADPKVDIMMLGDFNDESDDQSIRDHLHAVTDPKRRPVSSLLDTTGPIRDAGKGTFVYKNKWDLLDHIIVSPGLLDKEGFEWKPGSTQRGEFPELFYQPSYNGAIKRPSSTYSGNTFHKSGYSDHLPLMCIITQ